MPARNRELHDALRAFALEAAALLRDDQDRGAELEFDLDEGARRGGPALYHYRPLTARFIADRWHRLRGLPARAGAAEALGAGAAAYLRVNGLRGAEADPALRAMLDRLYEDATDFGFPEDRFERVFAEVERTLYERAQPATVLAAVHGLALEAERVELGQGLALVRGGHADAPDEALWGCDAEGGDHDHDVPREPNALVTLTREVGPGAPPPAGEARDRFRRLVTGLRLWKRGGVALAGVGWRRTGEGTWHPLELGSAGVARGDAWLLEADEQEPLTDFLTAIAAARSTGTVRWALRRFEMGCGRDRDGDALTDHLLALRALVGGRPDPAASDLALRVAVLCAEDGERRGVQRRLELAQALERFVVGDDVDADYVDAIGSDSPATLAGEVERHLRALLRDVLCGHLDPDLRGVSDELLLEQSDPPAPAPVPESPVDPRDPGVTTEIEAIESAGGEIGVTAARARGGVESQAALEYDWDDPAGYSAPV
jgi:hypothetical protein